MIFEVNLDYFSQGNVATMISKDRRQQGEETVVQSQ